VLRRVFRGVEGAHSIWVNNLRFNLCLSFSFLFAFFSYYSGHYFIGFSAHPPLLVKLIPNTTPASLLIQVITFNQVPKVLFQRITADPSELKRIANSDTTMLTRKLDNLQLHPITPIWWCLK
jgi:hypothetical protein